MSERGCSLTYNPIAEHIRLRRWGISKNEGEGKWFQNDNKNDCDTNVPPRSSLAVSTLHKCAYLVGICFVRKCTVCKSATVSARSRASRPNWTLVSAMNPRSSFCKVPIALSTFSVRTVIYTNSRKYLGTRLGVDMRRVGTHILRDIIYFDYY